MWLYVSISMLTLALVLNFIDAQGGGGGHHVCSRCVVLITRILLRIIWRS